MPNGYWAIKCNILENLFSKTASYGGRFFYGVSVGNIFHRGCVAHLNCIGLFSDLDQHNGAKQNMLEQHWLVLSITRLAWTSNHCRGVALQRLPHPCWWYQQKDSHEQRIIVEALPRNDYHHPCWWYHQQAWYAQIFTALVGRSRACPRPTTAWGMVVDTPHRCRRAE